MSVRPRRSEFARRRNASEDLDPTYRGDDDSRGRDLDDPRTGGGEDLGLRIAYASIQRVAEREVGGSNAKPGASDPQAEVIEISFPVIWPNSLSVESERVESGDAGRRSIDARHGQHHDVFVVEGERANAIREAHADRGSRRARGEPAGASIRNLFRFVLSDAELGDRPVDASDPRPVV